MKSILMLAAAVISGMAAALPVIRDGSVTFSQDAATGRVTIGYTLDGDPGVVTVDVLTNGVSIGGENLRRLGGDVNRKIETTGAKTISWIPDQTVNGFKLTDADIKAVVTAWPTNNLPDYLVIDLSMRGKYYFYPNEGQLPHGVTSHVYKTSQLVMRKIPAAGKTFRMGSPSTETGRVANDEKPHYVSFTNDFYLGIYEFTKGQAKTIQYENIAGYGDSGHTQYGYAKEYDEWPVEGMNYAYLRGSTSGWPAVDRGNGSENFTIPHTRVRAKLCIDLPTDAEWEFACRAGEGAARYDGTDDDSTLDDLAWYSANSGNTMHPVGLKKPNAWGLYDMYGNAREWTHSWYERYEECSCQVEPKGWIGNKDQDGKYSRICRGGAYNSGKDDCRSASRQKNGITTVAGRGLGYRVWCKAVIP
jgi:formylglycine-generating enzyme required for sulfatase activity